MFAPYIGRFVVALWWWDAVLFVSCLFVVIIVVFIIVVFAPLRHSNCFYKYNCGQVLTGILVSRRGIIIELI